jgi:hypothetical protein
VWGLISPVDFSNLSDFQKFWPILQTQLVEFNAANHIEEFSPKHESLTLSRLSALSPSQFPSACLYIINKIFSPDTSSPPLSRNTPLRDNRKEKAADFGKKLLQPQCVSLLASYLLEISSLAMNKVELLSCYETFCFLTEIL